MKVGVGLTLPPDCKIHAVVAETFMNFVGKVNDVEFRPYVESSIYIALNRNNVVTRFCKDNWANLLWFLDGDNGLEPEDFKLMIEHMKRDEIKILSAVYVQTGGTKFIDTVPMGWNLPHHPVPYMFDPIDKSSFLPPGKLANMTDHKKKQTFVAPGGCLMVKREVFEKTPFPWFQNYMDYRPDKNLCVHVGEDNYFCAHIQKHGFEIWLEPRVNSPHCKGSTKYTLKGEEKFIDKHRED